MRAFVITGLNEGAVQQVDRPNPGLGQVIVVGQRPVPADLLAVSPRESVLHPNCTPSLRSCAD